MATTYKVLAGSNLTKAAQAMGITLQQLLDANPQYKANPNMVQAGALLQYPVSTSTATPKADSVSGNTYTYQKKSYSFGTGPLAAQYPAPTTPTTPKTPTTPTTPTTTTTPTTLTTPVTPTTTTPATNDLSWLQNDANYKLLPTDMQNYLVQYYGILKVNDQQSQKKLLDALNTAQSQADP